MIEVVIKTHYTKSWMVFVKKQVLACYTSINITTAPANDKKNSKLMGVPKPVSVWYLENVISHHLVVQSLVWPNALWKGILEVLFVKFPTFYKSWNLHILLKKRVINIFFSPQKWVQLLVYTWDQNCSLLWWQIFVKTLTEVLHLACALRWNICFKQVLLLIWVDM